MHDTRVRAEAQTVRCRACGVDIGEVCVDRRDNDRPLTRFPAHPVRVNDAARALRGEAPPAQTGDAQELAAASARVEEQRAAAPAAWSATDGIDLDSRARRDFSEPLHEPSEDGQ